MKTVGKMVSLRLPVLWCLWKLGLVESGMRPLDEEEDPTIKPVYHDNPLFAAETWRVGACEAKTGGNQWFTVFACEAGGKPLAGVEIRWDIEWGAGMVADQPNWVGTTNEWGVCHFQHPSSSTRYKLFVDGELVLSNVRTDLDVDWYCNPYYDPGTGAMWGWQKINKPGLYGYYVYLTAKGNSLPDDEASARSVSRGRKGPQKWWPYGKRRRRW